MPSPGCVSPDSPWFSSWLRAASMSEEQPGPAPCGSAAARCLSGVGGKWELPVTLLGQEHGWVWGLHPWGVHGRGSRGNSPPQGWGFTLGEGNPPSRSGEVAEEEMATGFSCPLKESQLNSPHTFQLPRLQRKPASRTKVHFRAQKLAGN